MLKLDTVPQEILERIALSSATETLLGPPSSLVTLLSANRKINASLSFASNQVLYARIFAFKFDLGRSSRRLPDRSSPTILAHELVHRFRVLHRIRAMASAEDSDSEREILFHSYLMMLENAGKNEEQLRDYARMEDWLRAYLKVTPPIEQWPPHNDHTSLAMWLFWFLLRPADYANDDDSTWNILNVLKVYALGAHRYPLTDPSWVNFLPESRPHSPSLSSIVHYSEAHHLKVPPLATPAILSFLTLFNLKSTAIDFGPTLELPMKTGCYEWEYELGRCLSLSRPDLDKGVITESFRPGSVEGTWEGIFTYTEFTAYAALLQGAPPPVLQRSVIARHRQTWKLREHHHLASPPSPSPSPSSSSPSASSLSSASSPCPGTGSSSTPPAKSNADHTSTATANAVAPPLSAGDPLRAYFPNGTRIVETRDGLEVCEPNGNAKGLRYHRAALGGAGCDAEVKDIIITGEGHSAWGQFNLVGRVRPCDGFISLCKEYVDEDRGKWIYRGYLVGNVNSNLAGRWRDTLSPASVPGYEGCFIMTRRR